MGMNDTPSSERLHIGFFGRRNAGKSSVVNAVTNQNMSLVSDQKGTTTDPVEKTMELLPLGPVVIIDTAGFDDGGTLGTMRVELTKAVLNRVDIAVLVVDGTIGMTSVENELVSLFEEKKIPYLIVFNKCDLLDNTTDGKIFVSAKNNTNIELLKDRIAKVVNAQKSDKRLCGDLVNKNDFVVLVIPIDSAAPMSVISGLIFLSFISTLLLDFLSIQLRSVFVYATAGVISYKSAPAASATISAVFFVVPLALKYATSFFSIIAASFEHAFSAYLFMPGKICFILSSHINHR